MNSYMNGLHYVDGVKGREREREREREGGREEEGIWRERRGR